MKKTSSHKTGVIPIIRERNETRREPVYLLPKTIEYYQEQLTRLLESERFGEATEMLEFLLACHTDDALTLAEWRNLHQWLITTFGEPGRRPPSPDGRDGGDAGTEEDISERDLRKRQLDAKLAEDPAYVGKLLDIVESKAELDKKMLAVEQLALADHPLIDRTLTRWLEETNLHPLLQFKVLQTLRLRGAEGRVTLRRGGEEVTVSLADTPVELEEYPASIRKVPALVREVCERTDPGIAGFAGQVWQEFLACLYGTSVYKALARMPRRMINIWAASLHAFMVLAVTGDDPEVTLLPHYQLKDKDRDRVRKCRSLILAYMRNSYGPMEEE